MTLGRQPDPRWVSAADWLAAGSYGGPPDIALLGVPAHATSPGASGAHKTPAAVRHALRSLSTWSGSRRIDLGTLTAIDLGNVDDPDLGGEGEWRVRIAAESGAALARLVVLVGGDSSFISAAADGVLGDLSDAGLVLLDARHDVYDGRTNSSTVRRLLERGMPAERIVQVGIADWADARSYADESYARGVHAIHRREVADRGMAACIEQALAAAGARGRPVFVALDFNACDRATAPGCTGALPGGLSAHEVLVAAYASGTHPSVRAVAVTEIDAAADPTGVTVSLGALCVLEAAAGLVGRRAEPFG